MTEPAPFDAQQAHKVFAAGCFNQTWDLLELSDRSPEEEEQVLLLAHASLWHWTQREDCTPQNRSIGYWQISRVYAVLEQADNARTNAQKCLLASETLPPFYRGYAHEAMARSTYLLGDSDATTQHLAFAHALAADVEDPDERSMLEAELKKLLALTS